MAEIGSGTRERLRLLVEQISGTSPVYDESQFSADLGMDSMRFMVLLLAVEKEFDIEIPDRGLFTAGSTFQSFADFIMPLVEERQRRA